MLDEDTCDCAEHGQQPITFVCNHITAAPKGDTVAATLRAVLDLPRPKGSRLTVGSMGWGVV